MLVIIHNNLYNSMEEYNIYSIIINVQIILEANYKYGG
jgi:hypothetical protein